MKNDSYSVKPPLGLIPEKLFKEKRIKELSKVIDEHIQKDFMRGEYKNTLLKWLEELTRRIEEIT